MSQETLSGLALRDRQFNSYFQDNVPITDTNHTGSPAVGLIVGGMYVSGAPTYANGDGVPFRFNANGELMVDTELMLSGVTINNIKVYSTDGTVANVKYGKVDANGVLYQNLAQVGSTVTLVNAGNVGDGAQRVTIATDDINQAAINTYTSGTDVSSSAIKLSTSGIDVSTTTMAGWDNGAGDGVSVTGDVAHDGVDAGEPVKIGGYATDSQVTAVAVADRVNRVLSLNGENINRNHTYATNSDRTEEIDPLSQQFVPDELADTTNVASGTATYYPSSAGMSQDGFKDFHLQFGIGDTGGIIGFTVEATTDDAASPDFIDITPAGYRLDTNTTGVGSIFVTSGTSTGMMDWDELNVSKVRVKLVNNTATNSVQFHTRRKAL